MAAEQVDPVLSAIGRLSGHFGFNPASSLFEMLPRDDRGFLPFHQAEAALDLAGLGFERHQNAKLPNREQFYPALVKLQDGGAAAILEFSDDDVLVGDAANEEPVWRPLAEMQDLFAGDLITVIGNPDKLREEDAPWHSKARVHWFWSELRKERAAFRPVILASLIINTLAVALPLFSMNVYDRVIPNQAEATLWVLGTGVVLAFALEFALRTARTNVVDEIGKRLDLRLSQKLFARILASPMSERKGSTGALAARASEYSIVRDFFASTTIVLMVDMVFLVLFIAVIAYIAGWLALVPVVIMAIMAVAGFVLQRKVTDAARDAQSDMGLQQTMLVESIAGMETLKSVSGERSLLGRWRGLAEISGSSQLRLRQISAQAISLTSSFQQISTVSLVIGGYYLFAAGHITMGAIIAIVMLASRSLAPAGQIAFLLTRGRQAREALDSIENLFEAEDERQMGIMALPKSRNGQEITFEDMQFFYPDTSVAALSDVNLTIKAGERVAIIGRVASGKSTFGRVLCGLYPPSEGSMQIGGVDSRQYRPSDVRRVMRFVGQDANLFTGTIKENLGLGKPGASDEEIIGALRKSGADEYLTRDASGFDRQVGEQGRRLSGGQRAFLALSRAFVSDCDLLFLDEPTGAMDARTEALLVDKLKDTLNDDQTLVVATHRPALFSLCDRIIVMDHGRIVADGPKDEILAKNEGAGRKLS